MKIGLGTVQFGSDYGVSNRCGKPSETEAKLILLAAKELNISVIDTAFLYGNSEEVLGRCVDLNSHFDIVTKTPQFSKLVLTEVDAQYVEDALYSSLLNMCIPSVYGLLIHNVNDLFVPGGDFLMDRLFKLKQNSLVEKIGVSVYSGWQIDKVIEKFPIDLIQMPISVLDQRLLQSGHLQKLKKSGVEIHARSVFLQGLLLMELQDVPDYFDNIRYKLESYHRFIQIKNYTLLQSALGFVSSIPEIDLVICGVNNHQQLREISKASQVKVSLKEYKDFGVKDEAMINPAFWPKIRL